MTNIYHDLAKLKGFHDNDEFVDGKPTPRQMLAWGLLIHSEWLEYREEREPYYLGEGGKPEGTLVELADIYIRCQDAAAAMGQELAEPCKAAGDHMVWNKLCGKLAEHARMGDARAYCYALSDMCSFCLSAATRIVEEFDDGSLPQSLAAVVQIKHEFNKSRPFRHGKKA